MSFFSIQLSEILKYIDLHFPNGWRNTFLFAPSKVPKAIMFFLVWGTQSSNLDFRGENPQSQSSRMKAEGNTRLGHTKSSLRLWMLKLSSLFSQAAISMLNFRICQLIAHRVCTNWKVNFALPWKFFARTRCGLVSLREPWVYRTAWQNSKNSSKWVNKIFYDKWHWQQFPKVFRQDNPSPKSNGSFIQEANILWKDTSKKILEDFIEMGHELLWLSYYVHLFAVLILHPTNSKC